MPDPVDLGVWLNEQSATEEEMNRWAWEVIGPVDDFDEPRCWMCGKPYSGAPSVTTGRRYCKDCLLGTKEGNDRSVEWGSL